MRGNSTSASDRRQLMAAILFSAAVFCTAVLIVRLPQSTRSLSLWWTLATAAVVGGLCAGGIALLDRAGQMMHAGQRLVAAVLTGAITAAAILATTHQAGIGSVVVGCALAVLTLAGGIAWAAQNEIRSLVASVREGEAPAEPHPANAPPQNIDLPPATVQQPSPGPDLNLVSEANSGSSLPDHVDQTSSRYVADGRDHLETCLRVRFKPGQQTAIVHLPIQPAMNADPQVECESCDGSDLRIAVDPAQPYGVRLVCRRPAPCTEAGETVLAVLISADGAAVRAA
jgi:hypothetical protein